MKLVPAIVGTFFVMILAAANHHASFLGAVLVMAMFLMLTFVFWLCTTDWDPWTAPQCSPSRRGILTGEPLPEPVTATDGVKYVTIVRYDRPQRPALTSGASVEATARPADTVHSEPTPQPRAARPRG